MNKLFLSLFNDDVSNEVRNTSWSRSLFGKVMVIHLAKKFPTFMESEGSLPCSLRPDTGTHPELVQSNQSICSHPTALRYVSKLSSYICLHYPRVLFPSRFMNKVLYVSAIKQMRGGKQFEWGRPVHKKDVMIKA
jgi:hypothetical protein